MPSIARALSLTIFLGIAARIPDSIAKAGVDGLRSLGVSPLLTPPPMSAEANDASSDVLTEEVFWFVSPGWVRGGSGTQGKNTSTHARVGWNQHAVPPILSTCPLHNNSGYGKERRILIDPWCPAKAALGRNYLEVYWPRAGGLSAVNAIGTQLRDPTNSGLTRWHMAVINE